MKAQPLTLSYNLLSLQRLRFQNASAIHQYLHFPAAPTTVVGIQKNSVSNAVLNMTIVKSLPSKVICGVRGEDHAVHWRQLSAEDIVSGAVDVVGWTVHFETKGVAMGKVSELIRAPGPTSVSDHAGTNLTWLKVVESSARCRDELGEQMETHVLEGNSGTHSVILKQQKMNSFESIPVATEILVPVVDEIVKKVDKEIKTLFIFPPKGLLDFARRPDAIRRLYPAILEFCKQHPPENVRKRLRGTRFKNSGYMPTQRQLQQAGMQWLIKEINAAGGLLYVAQALNLYVDRRPPGFWENLTRLDIEIECFIWECWTKKKDESKGTHYYWNPVTDEVSEMKPPFPNISDFVKTKRAVMPLQSMVMAAKRWDLHHAIIFHGGYKAVGHALQRWRVHVHRRKTNERVQPKKTSRHSGDVKGLNSETLPTEQSVLMTLGQVRLCINKFMKSRGLSNFPTYKDLQLHDQTLYVAVKRYGGRQKVAKYMNIKLKRNEYGRWSSLSVAGAALRSYMCSKIAEEMCLRPGYNEEKLWKEAAMDGYLRLPTHAQVLNDGRADLHYVLQRFGRHRLAEYLKIPQRVMLPRHNDSS